MEVLKVVQFQFASLTTMSATKSVPKPLGAVVELARP